MQLLEQAYDCQDVVLGAQKDMGDCQIPVNIKVRENQVNQLSQRLQVITNEFNELKAADEAHEGSSESEREIKTLTLKIDRKLKALEAEKDGHFNY